MILDKRQINFTCTKVPEIPYSEKTDVEGYEELLEVFVEALMKKQCYYYKHKEDRKNKTYQDIIKKEREIYTDCLRQTIHFLKSIKALKPIPKKVESIELWHKMIKMTPFYEGVNAQLKSILIAHHYPEMNKNIKEGAVYSHQGLTHIGECTSYILEYFTKENLLNEEAKYGTDK